MYKLEANVHVMYWWIKAFQALSVEQILVVHDHMALPYMPGRDVRSLGRNVASTYYNFIGFFEYRHIDAPTAEINYLLPDEMKATNWKHMLLDEAFSTLAELDNSSEMYNWMQCTHQLRRLFNCGLEENRNWIALITDWGVSEFLRRSSMTTIPSFIHGDIDLSREFQDWEKVKYVDFGMPQLNPSYVDQLIQIALYYFSERKKLRVKIKHMMKMQQNSWEAFALGYGGTETWLHLQGAYKIDQRFWKAVFTLLDHEQIRALEEWGRKYENQRSTYTQLKSLTDFFLRNSSFYK